MYNGRRSTNVQAITIATNVYVNTSVTFVWPPYPRHVPVAERAMREKLEEFGREVLQVKLRRAQANKKAMLDARSRQRPSPHVNAQKGDRRLQTVDNALAARRGARRAA